MTVRNSSNAIKRGSIEAFNATDVVVFKKKFGTEEVLILVNVRNSKVLLDLPASLTNTAWTNALSNQNINLTTTLSLEPYTYLILKK